MMTITYFEIKAVELWEYEATPIKEVSEEEYMEMIAKAYSLESPDFPDHIENIRDLFFNETGLHIYAKQNADGNDEFFGFRLEKATHGQN